MTGISRTVKPVTDGKQQDLDAEEFLRALLKISAEDAEKVREQTPGTRPDKVRQEGPAADYGDDAN
jgi:hypothetical protein